MCSLVHCGVVCAYVRNDSTNPIFLIDLVTRDYNSAINLHFSIQKSDSTYQPLFQFALEAGGCLDSGGSCFSGFKPMMTKRV